MIAKFVGFALMIFLGQSADAEGARTVKCDESSVVLVYIRPQTGARFNFPIKPDDVVFGGSGLFSVKYVRNDIHVSPLTSSASTNMTVYFLGRSCTFKLVASQTRHDEIVLIKDSDSSKMKVKME
ncbi:hypothetical protein BH10BDE1_BH10BDE1_28030 [soil metagenome]